MKKIGLFLLVLMFLFSGSALAITFDGDFSDWSGSWTAWTGFTTSDSVGNPVTGVQDGVWYWEEDGFESDGYVGPGYGGQYFDIEAVYAMFDGTNLYIGVLTGHPEDYNPSYSMGDIGIDVDRDGVYEYGVDVQTGKFYSGLDDSDWKDATAFPSSNPACIDTSKTGSGLSLTHFFYDDTGQDKDGTDLWAIELMIPNAASWWTGGNIHITQSCGNDSGDLSVPEPATMLLLGLGLVGMAFVGRKKVVRSKGHRAA